MNNLNRRNFLKSTALAGGGFLLGFNYYSTDVSSKIDFKTNLGSLHQLNGYVKITSNNRITIMAPNPEGGQGVKTAMPMIVAEELDVDFSKIIIEQADLDTKHFTRQTIGGSQALHQGWLPLRNAGATARQMLILAAANVWNVPVNEVTTNLGNIHHEKSGKSATYGEMASEAAQIPIPEKIILKDPKSFKIIGKDQRNVDMNDIVSGKPLFGIDTIEDGMLIAMIIHPPAFGLRFKSIVNEASVKKMKGIVDVFEVKIFDDEYEKTFFDTTSFNEVVAIVGNTTWEVMQAKKALKVNWIPFESYTQKRDMLGRKIDQKVPSGLESSANHDASFREFMEKPGAIRRQDGDFTTAFTKAAKTLERTYTGPFLSHNCMEPMNFFAHVTDTGAALSGPLQKPELTEQALAKRLGLPVEKIDIKMTRLGGGYGRRSYAHWAIEAALISQKTKAPIKLMYTREDDMTSGIYRPAYVIKYKAALDLNNNLIAFHIKCIGLPESPLYPNRFPAGAVENYLAEDVAIDSNITIGSFRAPRSNFLAAAEQSFLDELAELAGKDPIDFRLALLKKAQENPFGKNNDYDAERYAEVLKLVREKSNWDEIKKSKKVGVSAYFCHDSYVAHIIDLDIIDGQLVVNKVWSAVDCGLVINPIGAKNLVEGSVVDGIGTALFGKLTFKDGVPSANNFHEYRMILMNESPKAVESYFVENGIKPTGMGEPAYPPVFAALANAIYKVTGNRLYNQPFNDNIT
jgi:isoquinoline 1-oxidoreductase beta subunit